MKPGPRLTAANAGEPIYTLKPCRHDGDVRRYTANGLCVTCCRRRAAEQNRQIRAAIEAGKKAAV